MTVSFDFKRISGTGFDILIGNLMPGWRYVAGQTKAAGAVNP
jgi:hypothetical protein